MNYALEWSGLQKFDLHLLYFGQIISLWMFSATGYSDCLFHPDSQFYNLYIKVTWNQSQFCSQSINGMMDYSVFNLTQTLINSFWKLETYHNGHSFSWLIYPEILLHNQKILAPSIQGMLICLKKFQYSWALTIPLTVTEWVQFLKTAYQISIHIYQKSSTPLINWLKVMVCLWGKKIR